MNAFAFLFVVLAWSMVYRLMYTLLVMRMSWFCLLVIVMLRSLTVL